MICSSMTGFGKVQAEYGDFEITCELKSVNNRFKDIRMKIPQLFSEHEIRLRKIVLDRFSRGSFDLSLSYKKSMASRLAIDFDYDKIRTFIDSFKNNVQENVSFSADLFFAQIFINLRMIS